jgi:cysteine desulfurase
MRKVYLDYAATTPVAPVVQKAMQPYWDKLFGNPAAMHTFGQEARQAVESAREKLAQFFNFAPEEIIFTSGATESNNLALRGVAKDQKGFVPHIITTPFEHHCLLDTAKDLLRGEAEITFINLKRDGVIDPKEILKALKSNTVLVSVMYVNNEIGTVAPLAEISRIIKSEKVRRQKIADQAGKKPLPLYFHSDVTQAVNYLPCDMPKLGVDLFSLSAHKIYGPKGVGALGVRKDVKIEKIQFGGSQEFNLRAGTHNVTGIVGMGAAVERIARLKSKETQKIRQLRDYFWQELQKNVKNISLNGSLAQRSANNLNVSFKGVEGESMLLALDMAGVACSTGSACSSETLEPSHVLLSIGLTHPEAHGSLRFTLGEGNCKADIDYVVQQIKLVTAKLRKISGFDKSTS